jgi:hypothetical protein
LILGYGSPTHSHMPLSETTPDSDLLSCLRRYKLKQWKEKEKEKEKRLAMLDLQKSMVLMSLHSGEDTKANAQGVQRLHR